MAQAGSVFRVRHKETGLYSGGGFDPAFSKKGKTWTSLGAVRSHLAQFRKEGYCRLRHPGYLDSVEIVEFVLTEVEGKTFSA